MKNLVESKILGYNCYGSLFKFFLCWCELQQVVINLSENAKDVKS